MADRLDVVAVGVEDERPVVRRMVRPQSGRPVVGAARGERRGVERVDGFVVRGRKRDVRPRPVRLALDDPELGLSGRTERNRLVLVELHRDRPAERRQRLLVERAARRVVLHVEPDVVEHQILRAWTAVPYAQISVQILPSSDVSKRNAMTAFAPFASASSIRRLVASSRPAASIFVMPFNSPPTIDFNAAPSCDPRLRERTVSPKTSPNTSRISQPGRSFIVVISMPT